MKILPCPFCGGDNIEIIPADIIAGTQYWKIYCYRCGCTQTPTSNKEDAVDTWNTRPNPWHTGTPTDRDGIFLIRTKMNNLFLVRWAYGFWEETTGDDCLEDNDILAWQKITLNEEKEDGR